MRTCYSHYEVRARNEREQEIVVGYTDGDPEFNPIVDAVLHCPELKLHAPRVIDINELLKRYDS